MFRAQNFLILFTATKTLERSMKKFSKDLDKYQTSQDVKDMSAFGLRLKQPD